MPNNLSGPINTVCYREVYIISRVYCTVQGCTVYMPMYNVVLYKAALCMPTYNDVLCIYHRTMLYCTRLYCVCWYTYVQ